MNPVHVVRIHPGLENPSEVLHTADLANLITTTFGEHPVTHRNFWGGGFTIVTARDTDDAPNTRASLLARVHEPTEPLYGIALVMGIAPTGHTVDVDPALVAQIGNL